VVVEMIDHSGQQDGYGRLGNYLVLFDPESEKCILLTRNQLPEREVIEDHYGLKITPLSDMVVKSAAFF
jgi:hypothetical protein